MPRSTGVISMLIAALRLTLPSSANSKPVSRSSTDTDWLRLVATLDDPGTGRGRVEHARAARWLTSQRTPQFNAILECVVPSTAAALKDDRW
jgi:hypothetical protein